MIKPYAVYDTMYFNVPGISSVVSCNCVSNGNVRLTEIAFSLYFPDYGEIDFRYVNGRAFGRTLMDRTLLRALKESLPWEFARQIPEVCNFAEKSPRGKRKQ